MPKLSDLQNEPVSITFEHRGREFTWDVFPERATRALRRKCAEAEDAEPGAGEALLITATVKAWDLTDGDGAPLPLTAETAADISPGLKLAYAQALGLEAANPTKAARPTDSSDSSLGQTVN